MKNNGSYELADHEIAAIITDNIDFTKADPEKLKGMVKNLIIIGIRMFLDPDSGVKLHEAVKNDEIKSKKKIINEN